MKITKRELRRLLGEAKLEKGYESWDDWQNPGNYAPTEKPVSKAAAEEKVAYSPSGRVEHPSREEMWGFDEEPDYDAMDVGPVPSRALVKRVVPNEYDLEFAEEFGGEEDVDPASMFDYETGEDDVPYGAADYALMQGRGRRTDEGRRLREAKGDKKRGSEAAEKTRPDGYYDLPAFMSINKQSPAKYSSFHADDPAVVDPLGQDIDADALRIVRQLQARGVGKKEDKKKKLKEATVNVTRRDIRRLVNEALDEMSMMGSPRGMRRPRRGMCLYVIYSSGMTVSYYVADPPPPDATPEEFDAIETAAMNTGTDVTPELDPEGMGMADALTLYSWLQDHDEITHVHDIESTGGVVPKRSYMNQVRQVGEAEGLFAPEDVVNEGSFPEQIEGIYGEEPPEFDEMGPGDDSFLDYDPEEIPDMDDQYDPDYYEGLDDEEDDYAYGDDPDEFLDLPAGEIQQRLDRGPVPRRGLRETTTVNESIDLVSAGIGAIVGIAALYAAGPLARVATNILNNLSDAQRYAAMDKAREKAGTEMAELADHLSRDTKLVALFKELEAAQEDGTSREVREKSKEITAYISEKRKEMSFGHGDTQSVRRGVAKRLKKGDDDKDDKGDKLDEARWAKLAGILKG